MSEEAHHLVELALGTVEALMAPKKQQPKVILFDIGGVCVSHCRAPLFKSQSLMNIDLWVSNSRICCKKQ